MSPAQGSDALQAFTAAPLLRPGPVGVQFSGFCGQRSSLLRRSPWARTSSDAHQDRVQRRKTFSFSYESPRPFDVFAIVASEVQRPITITPSLAPRLARTDFGDEYLNILESAADLDLSGRPRTVNNGFPHTDESKAKISAANKGKTPWNKGRKHSEETKRKIAEATRAAMQKPGMIAKMRQNQLGKKHKPETKEKIKERLHDPDVQAKIVAARVKRYGFPEERARLREEREEVRQREMEARRHLVREIQEAGELAFAAGLQSAMPLLVPPSCCSGVYGSYPRPLDADRVIALERRLASNAPPTASRRGATHMSEETRAKLRESIRARWQDPEYRAKHAAGMAGKGIGRKLSEAHKAKIRETLLRRSAAIHGMDPDEAVERGTAVVGARTRDRRSSSSASGGFLLTRRSLAREAGVTSLGGTADLTNRRYESGSGSEDGRGSLRGSGVAVRTGDNGNGSGSLGGAGASQSRAREPQLKGLFGSLYKDEEEEKPAPSPRPREAASAARLSPSPAASPKRKEPKEPKPRGRPRQAPKALDEDLEIDASDINLDGFDDEVVTATPPRRRAAADDDDDIRDAWADDEEEEEEAPAPVKRKRAAARPSKRRSKAEEIVYRKVYKNGRLVEVQAVPAEKKDAFWYLRHSQSFW